MGGKDSAQYMQMCPSWPKEHDWKSCMPQKGIWGSNPHLSARKSNALRRVSHIRGTSPTPHAAGWQSG